MTEPTGVLVVDKPRGPTSHDVVAQARRLFGTRSVGHAGTLDPMASGVLVVLIGEATKLSSSLVLDRKSYRATVRFGSTTDSDDAMGRPLTLGEVRPGWLDESRLAAAIERERGRTKQTPPQVSAIKQGGVAAYKLHRQGKAAELADREVAVHALQVLSVTDDELELELSVSKGYYVRALARDLGEALEMPAHLSMLRRTSSGGFSLEEAVAWPCAVRPSLLSLSDAVRRALPIRRLDAEGLRRARLGQRLDAVHFVADVEESEAIPAEGVSAWLDEAGSLVALGQREPDGSWRVLRGFRCTEP